MAAGWRRALVTGASSGIGRGFAERLAAGGTALVVVARREHLLEDLAADVSGRFGVDVEVLAGDLTEPDMLHAVEERVAAGRSPVDLLVNNAGIGASGPLAALPPERARQAVDLNVRAAVRITHAALGGMVDRGRGGVLTVASMAAFQPLPFSATYAASKAFLTDFSQALHEELRGTGVTTTVVCPGFVRTPLAAGIEQRVPGWAFLRLADVVGAALRGLARGRAVVVPGAPYRVHAAAARLLPSTLLARATGWAERGRVAGG